MVSDSSAQGYNLPKKSARHSDRDFFSRPNPVILSVPTSAHSSGIRQAQNGNPSDLNCLCQRQNVWLSTGHLFHLVSHRLVVSFQYPLLCMSEIC
jgi:hypothetical protein